MSEKHDANRKVSRTLFLVVLGMFGFGFAMVPLYKLVCQVAGINGIASETGRIKEGDLGYIADRNRIIKVEFDATINTGLPWEFRPNTKDIEVHPGEPKVISYYAKNTSDKPITGQAIPGVTPWQATKYFHKIECFCFTQQTLQPGEEVEMPVRFVIDPELSKEYQTVTLSYTFMNTDREIEKPAGYSVSQVTQ